MSDTELESGQHSPDGLALRREKIRMLYGQLPLIFLADIAAGGFLFAVQLENSTHWTSFAWIAALVGTTVIRALMARSHLANRTSDADIPMRWRFLIFGAGISGIIWGNAWLLLAQQPEVFDVIVVAVWIIGMQAGAAATMVVIKRVFLAFLIPSSLCLIGYLLQSGAEDAMFLAVAFLMYTAFIVPVALRSGEGFEKTLLLQISNDHLLKTLGAEESRLEQKEQELAEEKAHYQRLQRDKAKADERLQAAAEVRLLLLDTVGEGIFGLDARGNITFINSTAQRILKWEEKDLIGSSVLRLLSSDETKSSGNAEAFVAINQCLQDRKPIHTMECRLLTGEKSDLPVRFSCTPIIQSDSLKGAVVGFMDISEQKEMESMLLQSQKMEAIGRLTGGVAHDFNNLLTVIMGNLSFLRQKLPEEEQLLGFVDKTMEAADKGAALTSRLLGLSREQEIETEPLEIDDVIGEMAYFLDRLLGETIELELDLQAGDAATLSNRNQLENALLNLGANARDAMGHGGVLKISTSKQHLRNSLVRQDDSLGEDDYIQVQITDSGHGIDADTLKQVFEPFFTTKEKDKGTGLGLATVYGFIRQTGGNISVTSQPGEWTTFTLYLPVSKESRPDQQSPRASSDSRPALAPMRTHCGKILVVEDNSDVQEVAVRTLKDAGFDVLAVGDGNAALQCIQVNADIEVVFTDVIMPGGMSGFELTEKLIELRPKLPVLLASAYTDQHSKEELLALDNVAFIPKPYDIEQLPGQIQSMLDRALKVSA